MSEERRLSVLRAIVQDYVAMREPVGSKALVERHGLGVSPATIRNDMAVLEEQGLIAQPHTSAGRIPTDAGYRLFVDRLSAIKPLSPAERRAIATFLDGAVGLDDVVARSVRLLAQLTQQVAMVQYPTLSASSVRHVEVVRVSPARVLVVLILSTGRVEQRMLELLDDVSEEDVADVRPRLLEATRGRRLTDAVAGLTEVPEQVAPEQRAFASKLVGALSEAMSDRAEERVVVGGTANIGRFGTSFEGALSPLLEALEEHVVLMRLLGEVSTNPAVTVRIGTEGPVRELAGTSVVATGYGAGDSPLAALGIVGPTRMDYPGTMAAVRAVAHYVSTMLDDA